MSLITRMRTHYAVYWEFDYVDRYGRDVYKDPLQVKVRWEDRQERDVLPTGEEYMTKSVVYVDREIAPGGILWRGLLVDAPTVPPEHNRVKTYSEIPKLRGSQVLRIARL